MSKGKEKSRSKTRSPERRYRSREWTDATIQSILDAAPSDEARKVLLSNPNMMKALLRRASRHTDADGAADTSIFKRIFADEVFNSATAPEISNLRQREDRLQSEMQRAQEAELRLLQAQAKVNQLILEKQKANMAAEQAKEEAARIQMRLESIREDIERRGEAMKRLEEDYDKLDQEAARVRSENYKLKLKEAHAAGRAAGRTEGRTIGRKEGAQMAYEEGYGEGFALGSREMADKLMKHLEEEDGIWPPEVNGASRPDKGHSRQASGSSRDGFQEFRNLGKRSSERGRDRDREKERYARQAQPQGVPTVLVQPPSASEQSPPQMPEPEIPGPPPPQSPSPSSESTSPTPAQQVIRDYHESPDREAAPIPIRNVSPRPHPVRNPLPDNFIPVVSENDPDGLMFDMPAAHEFGATPGVPSQPLPSQQSPRYSPHMFGHDSIPPQHSGSNIPAFIPQQHTGGNAPPFIPPTRELPPPKSSILSRDPRPRSDSPDRSSTPLSEMSLLQRQQSEDESGIVMPYTYQMLKRNHSVLSVIQEQSDTDNASPVAQRMHSQSPGLMRQYEAAPMQMPTPTLSYVPASVDGMTVTHDDTGHYHPSMGQHGGQPMGRHYDDGHYHQEAYASPMMPSYAVAPIPDPPPSFVPVMQPEMSIPTPFVPPQNRTPEPTFPPPPVVPQITVTRSGTKKGKKEKKRSQDNVVPEIQINPPPQEQPPQLTPQVTPQRMPVPAATVNSDSDDSAVGGKPPPIAPQPPPPPAFVPRAAATPPPAAVPFIPPPPVIPKSPTPEPPPP
ncbi:hypothetical protein FRB90_006121 [Tulasnella sp. 427]|nr:hypothetical protein FRB90_006121 [Tulasnella sp. 427]